MAYGAGRTRSGMLGSIGRKSASGSRSGRWRGSWNTNRSSGARASSHNSGSRNRGAGGILFGMRGKKKSTKSGGEDPDTSQKGQFRYGNMKSSSGKKKSY